MDLRYGWLWGHSPTAMQRIYPTSPTPRKRVASGGSALEIDLQNESLDFDPLHFERGWIFVESPTPCFRFVEEITEDQIRLRTPLPAALSAGTEIFLFPPLLSAGETHVVQVRPSSDTQIDAGTLLIGQGFLHGISPHPFQTVGLRSLSHNGASPGGVGGEFDRIVLDDTAHGPLAGDWLIEDRFVGCRVWVDGEQSTIIHYDASERTAYVYPSFVSPKDRPVSYRLEGELELRRRETPFQTASLVALSMESAGIEVVHDGAAHRRNALFVSSSAPSGRSSQFTLDVRYTNVAWNAGEAELAFGYALGAAHSVLCTVFHDGSDVVLRIEGTGGSTDIVLRPGASSVQMLDLWLHAELVYDATRNKLHYRLEYDSVVSSGVLDGADFVGDAVGLSTGCFASGGMLGGAATFRVLSMALLPFVPSVALGVPYDQTTEIHGAYPLVIAPTDTRWDTYGMWEHDATWRYLDSPLRVLHTREGTSWKRRGGEAAYVWARKEPLLRGGWYVRASLDVVPLRAASDHFGFCMEVVFGDDPKRLRLSFLREGLRCAVGWQHSEGDTFMSDHVRLFAWDKPSTITAYYTLETDIVSVYQDATFVASIPLSLLPSVEADRGVFFSFLPKDTDIDVTLFSAEVSVGDRLYEPETLAQTSVPVFPETQGWTKTGAGVASLVHRHRTPNVEGRLVLTTQANTLLYARYLSDPALPFSLCPSDQGSVWMEWNGVVASYQSTNGHRASLWTGIAAVLGDGQKRAALLWIDAGIRGKGVYLVSSASASTAAALEAAAVEFLRNPWATLPQFVPLDWTAPHSLRLVLRSVGRSTRQVELWTEQTRLLVQRYDDGLPLDAAGGLMASMPLAVFGHWSNTKSVVSSWTRWRWGAYSAPTLRHTLTTDRTEARESFVAVWEEIP